jgi:hypothetical protein
MKSPKRLRNTPKVADWRRQRQAIQRVLDVIGPLVSARMECLHFAVDAVRAIANKTPREPSGKMKSQLKATAAAFRKARSALASLPDRLRYCVLVTLDAPERFVGDLDQLIERCGDQAGKIVVEGGGGGEDERLDARRKEAAAISAFELLAQYGDGFPEGDRFYRLASLLFEAATGRAEVDCKNACLACSRPVRRQAAFNKGAWRRRKSPTTA